MQPFGPTPVASRSRYEVYREAVLVGALPHTGLRGSGVLQQPLLACRMPEGLENLPVLRGHDLIKVVKQISYAHPEFGLQKFQAPINDERIDHVISPSLRQ